MPCYAADRCIKRLKPAQKIPAKEIDVTGDKHCRQTEVQRNVPLGGAPLALRRRGKGLPASLFKMVVTIYRDRESAATSSSHLQLQPEIERCRFVGCGL